MAALEGIILVNLELHMEKAAGLQLVVEAELLAVNLMARVVKAAAEMVSMEMIQAATDKRTPDLVEEALEEKLLGVETLKAGTVDLVLYWYVITPRH